MLLGAQEWLSGMTEEEACYMDELLLGVYGVDASDTIGETALILIRGLLSPSVYFSTEIAVFVVHLLL